MELKEAIENRRSIRKFDQTKLEKHIIEEIIHDGTLAPSAKNRQPWKFIVIQNEQIKNSIVEEMMKEVENRIHMGKNKGSIEETAKAMKQAPCLVMIFNIEPHNCISDIQSIGACIENMCLSATDKGLGSLWINDIYEIEDKLKNLLHQEEHQLVAGLALGYSLQSPKPRPRKSIEEVMEIIE